MVWVASRFASCAIERASISTCVRHASIVAGDVPLPWHSRLSTPSSVDRSPRSMACASMSAMLCPRSTGRLACFWPAIREIACLMRARSAVKVVEGAPVPKPATATRSDGDSRSTNAFAAFPMACAPPKRMFGSSTASTMSRPLGRALVGAVAVGRSRRRRRGAAVADERHPLGGRHAAAVAVHAHDELVGREVRDGLAAIVDHGDVERGDFDRRLEARRLLRRLLGRGGRRRHQARAPNVAQSASATCETALRSANAASAYRAKRGATGVPPRHARRDLISSP